MAFGENTAWSKSFLEDTTSQDIALTRCRGFRLKAMEAAPGALRCHKKPPPLELPDLLPRLPPEGLSLRPFPTPMVQKPEFTSPMPGLRSRSHRGEREVLFTRFSLPKPMRPSGQMNAIDGAFARERIHSSSLFAGATLGQFA